MAYLRVNWVGYQRRLGCWVLAVNGVRQKNRRRLWLLGVKYDGNMRMNRLNCMGGWHNPQVNDNRDIGGPAVEDTT